jgi:hypothetical protein
MLPNWSLESRGAALSGLWSSFDVALARCVDGRENGVRVGTKNEVRSPFFRSSLFHSFVCGSTSFNRLKPHRVFAPEARENLVLGTFIIPPFPSWSDGL